MTGWSTRVSTGPARLLHERPVPPEPERSLWFHHVESPALVLGSTQPDDHVDADRCRTAGVEVIRRPSGGGAVLLTPGGQVWLDAVIGRDDTLWDDDVGRAMWWLGETWSSVLADLTGERCAVHRGPLVRTRWSSQVCFAGLGAGEVTIDGRKVVGISQRRTRTWARFQSCCLLRWEPEHLAELLTAGPDPTGELADVARGIDAPVTAVVDAIEAAFGGI